MSKRRTIPIEIENTEPQLCTIHLRLKILRQLPFFKSLPDQAIEAVNTLFRAEAYEAGQFLYYAGDPAVKLYVIAEGQVKLLRHAPAGQEVIVNMLVPGEFFGSLPILGETTHADTAQAHASGCLLTITAEHFQDILQQHPGVSLSLLEIVSARLREAREIIQRLSASPVESRLAATLIKLAAKIGQDKDGKLLIQMPLSRQDLAEMTGATIETVSRSMSQFQKQGLIESGRRWVAITDLEGLEAVIDQ